MKKFEELLRVNKFKKLLKMKQIKVAFKDLSSMKELQEAEKYILTEKPSKPAIISNLSVVHTLSFFSKTRSRYSTEPGPIYLVSINHKDSIISFQEGDTGAAVRAYQRTLSVALPMLLATRIWRNEVVFHVTLGFIKLSQFTFINWFLLSIGFHFITLIRLEIFLLLMGQANHPRSIFKTFSKVIFFFHFIASHITAKFARAFQIKTRKK